MNVFQIEKTICKFNAEGHGSVHELTNQSKLKFIDRSLIDKQLKMQHTNLLTANYNHRHIIKLVRIITEFPHFLTDIFDH